MARDSRWILLHWPGGEVGSVPRECRVRAEEIQAWYPAASPSLQYPVQAFLLLRGQAKDLGVLESVADLNRIVLGETED